MPIIAAIALLAVPDPDLDWLAGKWCTEKTRPAKATTCETWTVLADGVMRGVGETWREGSTTIDERMEIRRDGDGFALHSEPNRQEPADFHARGPQPALAVRFENRAHDYPQVVRYWREGEMLMAEISLADGGKPRRWVYRRMIDPE